MLKQEFIYFRDKTRNKMYFTLFENKLYYSQREHGIDRFFINETNVYEAFRKSCLAHNFYPFWFNFKMCGLGGMDDWKSDKKWRGIDYEEFKEMFESHFQKPYKRGKEFYKEIKHKFDTTRIKDNCRGIYLLESENGINWKLKNDKPVITVNNKGFNSSLKWKSSEFDTKISIAFLGDSYFIYLRNNIDRDKRFIQYTKTKDFINFEEFKNIDIKYDKEKDNYYFIEVFKYKDLLFGFIPYYNNDECSIRFVKSKDGHKWEIIDDFFKTFPFIIEGDKRKNRDHICGGVTYKKKDIFFYVHHNVLGYDTKRDVNINCYSMPKGFLNELC